MMREHPDELRADFQEHFGLCIDDMGTAFSTLHAAALIGQLPEGSRVRAAYDADSVWTTDRVLAAGIFNALQFIAWTKTKDAQRGVNRPCRIGPSRARGGDVRRSMAMTSDELEAVLSAARSGVNIG